MAVLSDGNCSTAASCNFIGEKFVWPLVDDGAPYSAIGNVKLRLLLGHLGKEGGFVIEPIPSSLHGHTHWQYGVGEHASAPRAILGSVKVPAVSENGRSVLIRHLVLDGSSQWVIGKNVTGRSNILHIDYNALQFMADGVIDHFSMTTIGLLSYLPMSVFSNEPCNTSALSCLSGILLKDRPWSQVKSIADKVHKHVCGHANFTDVRLLLERNS